MAVVVNGTASSNVSAKDIVLAIVGRLGTGGGAGYVVEYRERPYETSPWKVA